MRLTMPASTLPGPHSTMCVDAARPDRLHVSTQRTGPKAWRYSASRIAAGSVSHRDVDVVDHRDARRGERDVAASRSFSASAAGFIRLEWNGADTGSGSARLAPAAFSASQALLDAGLGCRRSRSASGR